MARYHGNETVNPGFYWNPAKWEITTIEKKGAALPGGGSQDRARMNRAAQSWLSPSSRNGRGQRSMDRFFGTLRPKNRGFSEALASVIIALPLGREFLVGKFNTAGFWRDAPADLQAVARQWFAAKEGGKDGRNTLLAKWLGRKMPELKGLADKLFDFKVVKSIQDVSVRS